MLIAFSVASTSCGDLEEPIEEDDDVPTVTGFATDAINHTHKIGGDPCPQDVANRIEVFCFEASEFTSCDADSVVLSDADSTNSAGLSAEFISGGNSATFDGTKTDVKYVALKFTCAIAQSFVHKYKVSLYKDGVLVKEEEITVNVTVEQ